MVGLNRPNGTDGRRQIPRRRHRLRSRWICLLRPPTRTTGHGGVSYNVRHLCHRHLLQRNALSKSLSHTQDTVASAEFPLKLFYVSNIPVIFAAALFGNVYFISQILWQRYNSSNTNFWFNLLGTFTTQNNQYQPSGGLVYYVQPPTSLTLTMQEPLRALIYSILLIIACVFFAVTWVEVGGIDSRTVSKQLLDSGMQIKAQEI